MGEGGEDYEEEEEDEDEEEEEDVTLEMIRKKYQENQILFSGQKTSIVVIAHSISSQLTRSFTVCTPDSPFFSVRQRFNVSMLTF